MIYFSNSEIQSMSLSSSPEWLVTNGIGSYAMGTVHGFLARRYHGLLLAALTPPTTRVLMFSKLDETITSNQISYPLYTDRKTGKHQSPTPQGYKYIHQFHLDGTSPVWQYAFENTLLEKRIWMQQGENTTYIQYRCLEAPQDLHINLKAIINYRDFHLNTSPGDFKVTQSPVADGLKFSFGPNTSPLHLFCPSAKITPRQDWQPDYYHSTENYRGLPHMDANFLAAEFELTLSPTETITFIASTEPAPNLNGDQAWQQQKEHENKLMALAASPRTPPWKNQLLLAADQFIVKREIPGQQPGGSIIAGYPWFADWGRDTMISLPGLTLSTNRPQLAASILRTFSHFVDKGMLPNRFPDIGEHPEYNTIDATLWYFEAINSYYQATQDKQILIDLYPIMEDIIKWHQKGTRYNIKVDPQDNLLSGGRPDVQLTWMDAKVDGWVVTPRQGKAVEINALWHNALKLISKFAIILNKDPAPYNSQAQQALRSFQKFWNAEKGFCFDVIDSPQGNSDSLRPNQLIAVSVSNSPLSKDQQTAIIDICQKELLTPFGLRSLSSGHPDYISVYGGDRKTRDRAYHQGTVWGWLIGPFIRAHLKVYQDPQQAHAFLLLLIGEHLSKHGLGTVSEIFDGASPHHPRGCIAQAWSVAEILSVMDLIEKLPIEK